MFGGRQQKLATDMTPSSSSGLTLAEIFARIPSGDDRLAALAAWWQAQDRLQGDKAPAGEARAQGAAQDHRTCRDSPHVAGDEARREWEQRRDEAQAAKEADEAAALRARVIHAAELICARVTLYPTPLRGGRRCEAARDSGVSDGKRSKDAEPDF
jgi:hypothetical protein